MATVRNLLVLDIDETLIHASDQALERPADFKALRYHVYKRPGLNDFIVNCAELFDLAVWSSASDDYVTFIVQEIFPEPEKLEFIWGRSRATFRRSFDAFEPHNSYDPSHFHYIKPLAKVKKATGRSLENILIVDDTPQKCVRNYGNAIYPKPFEGDLVDDELPLLTEYLSTLSECENVRKVEKRRWRDEVRSRLTNQ